MTKTWHKWKTTVANRSAGRKCGKCYGSGGFKSDNPGSLYLIQGKVEGHNVIQFGISHDLKNRLRNHKASGFNKTLALLDFQAGIDAMTLERKLINLMKEYSLESCRAQGIIFDGASEAFRLEDTDEGFLEDFTEALTLFCLLPALGN